jgi:hypothetical protein
MDAAVACRTPANPRPFGFSSLRLSIVNPSSYQRASISRVEQSVPDACRRIVRGSTSPLGIIASA